MAPRNPTTSGDRAPFRAAIHGWAHAAGQYRRPRQDCGMRPTILSSVAVLGTALVVGVASAHKTQNATVAYPDGYRTWSHVKSGVISPTHRDFGRTGGFQHVYANAEAMAGYRTRNFPEGAVIVVDWLAMHETNGAYQEGERRQVDVMVKDSKRFASTGGWGFQRFVKDSRTDLAASPSPQQCFACHDQRKKDGLVISTYRP